ncbi:MAG: DUF3237 domain-containing protein [Myxococcota bacterium]
MKLVPLMTLKGRVEAPIEIGKLHNGTRRIYNVVGGEFHGDRLRGTVLPGGGEWFMHGDGSLGEVDVRLTLQTDEGATGSDETGAHIFMRYTGVMDFNEKVLHALSAGRPSEFGDNRFLTQVRFECGDPRYAWLTTTIAVGEGRVHPDCVEYAVYEVAHS